MNQTTGIKFQNILRIAPLVLIALIGMGIVWWITRSGPGMSGDSIWYQMGAENLLAGRGYLRFSGAGELRPITQFPPFYSMVLAGIGFSGLDLISAGRWLNIMLLAFNMVMVWYIVERESHSLVLAILAVTLMLVNLGIIKYYSWVMTEPLYTSFSLVCLLFLLKFSKQNRLFDLILAAIIAGLAVITRLIALSLIVAGVGFLMVSSLGKIRQKLIRSILFLAISIVPVFLWLLQSSGVGDGTFNRSVAFHPMSIELIKGYFFFLGNWIQIHRLIPGKYRLLIAVIVVLTGPFLYAMQWIKENWRDRSVSMKPGDSTIFLLLFYAVIYMITLYINTTFIDASTTAYAPERYLTSIYPIFVIFILLIYYRVWEHAGRKQIATYSLALLVATNVILQGTSTFQEIRQDRISLGYTDFIREHPAFIAVVRQNAHEHVIYSNNPELTYAISGVGAYILPFRINTGTALVNPHFLQEVNRMEADLQKGARIIHYGEKDAQQVYLYNSLDLRTFFESPEGEIYIAR